MYLYITLGSHSAAPTVHIWNKQARKDTCYNSLAFCYTQYMKYSTLLYAQVHASPAPHLCCKQVEVIIIGMRVTLINNHNKWSL